MRNMLSQDVCPYVRLSVTRRYCVETAKHIIKVSFHRLVATPFYVFPTKHHHRQMGALKMTDMKLQDMKMTDQVAGHEIAGHENDGPNSRA